MEILTKYPVISPFQVLTGGGSHRIQADVALITPAVTLWGGADGTKIIINGKRFVILKLNTNFTKERINYSSDLANVCGQR